MRSTRTAPCMRTTGVFVVRPHHEAMGSNKRARSPLVSSFVVRQVIQDGERTEAGETKQTPDPKANCCAFYEFFISLHAWYVGERALPSAPFAARDPLASPHYKRISTPQSCTSESILDSLEEAAYNYRRRPLTMCWLFYELPLLDGVARCEVRVVQITKKGLKTVSSISLFHPCDFLDDENRASSIFRQIR